MGSMSLTLFWGQSAWCLSWPPCYSLASSWLDLTNQQCAECLLSFLGRQVKTMHLKWEWWLQYIASKVKLRHDLLLNQKNQKISTRTSRVKDVLLPRLQDSRVSPSFVTPLATGALQAFIACNPYKLNWQSPNKICDCQGNRKATVAYKPILQQLNQRGVEELVVGDCLRCHPSSCNGRTMALEETAGPRIALYRTQQRRSKLVIWNVRLQQMTALYWQKTRKAWHKRKAKLLMPDRWPLTSIMYKQNSF